MGRRQGKNSSNNLKNNMKTPDPSDLMTERLEHHILEEVENSVIMKAIESLKQGMNNSLKEIEEKYSKKIEEMSKEIEEKYNKKFEEMSKFVNDTLGNQEKTIKQVLERLGIQGLYLNIIKAIYSKPTANIKLNGEKLKAIPLKSGTRQGCPLSPYLFNIVLEVLAIAIRQHKGIKGIQIGKDEVKLSLFADDMIVYISDPKNSTKELRQLINTFSNVAGYKTNSKKSIALLYTKDKEAEREIRETSPFTIATKSIKYLGVTLIKEVKDLFDKNFKFWKKEIGEDTRKWKDLPCSWIGRINIVKMAILPKAIYRSNAIPIKIPSNFFTDLEKKIIRFIWQNKKSRIAKAILYNKGTSGGITILDFKLYYTATVLKTACYWHENREVHIWNRIEDPDNNPQMYEHLIFDKGTKGIQWKKESIFNKWCWHNWMSTCRRMKVDPYLSPYTNLKSKWIKDININLSTLNLIEEKVGSSLQDIGTGDCFLSRTPVSQTIRESMNKWDLLKLRSFCKAKDTVSKTKRLPSDWEKIFTNPSSDKGIYRKPSLLALPAPLVKSGGVVTLKCSSEIVFETFILVLHRKGLRADPLYLVGESHDGGVQANVSIAPVTTVHAGTCRCYGSVSDQPYEWSDPSDSLDIKITGQEGECPDRLDPQNPVYAEETSPSVIVNGFSERLRASHIQRIRPH
ncbi:hypothetical protein U0070_017973 [Myodes glareolus]|uniref:RNA-directed DNA polymerase n=1 Tax=Myodes glareolus TaxID=447135 RepID=A0AAW0HFJ1_MYOGA